MNKHNLTDYFSVVRNFDLNLLTMFEAVYIHSSVTRAAEALDFSPSAVSQGLHKLRTHFSDPLFVREGQSLKPTSIATNIHSALNESYAAMLMQLKALSDTSLNNRLIVSCSPYVAMRLLPLISKVVADIAPACKIVHTSHNNALATVDEALTFRKADLIFDLNPLYSFSTVTQKIFDMDVGFFCSTNHPRLDDTLCAEQAKNEKFAIVDTDNSDAMAGQLEINEKLGGRRFGLRSPSFFSIASVAEETDTICVLPLWFFEKFKYSLNLKRLEADFDVPNVSVYMVYNKTSLQHPLFAHIVEEITRQYPS